MGLFDWMTQVLEGRKFRQLDQTQNEALVRALAGAMLADGEVAGAESEELETFVDFLTWQSTTSPAAFVGEAIEDAREAVETQDARDAFCADVAASIDDQKVRDEIYYMAARIVGADENLDERERAYLESLVQALEISADTQRVVTNRLISEELV